MSRAICSVSDTWTTSRYRYACRTLHVDPSDAIAFEDSAIGVRAAQDAGLMVVGVPSNPTDGPLPADLVVDRLDDPQLLRLLHLLDAASDARAHVGRTCMDLLDDPAVGAGTPTQLRALAQRLQRAYDEWAASVAGDSADLQPARPTGRGPA
jgi:hypothetical protein